MTAVRAACCRALATVTLLAGALGCSEYIPTDTLLAEPAGSRAPIHARDKRWTWVPYRDAQCADGHTTGMGINLTSGSQDVLIFLQAGGACWDSLSCEGLVKTASNLRGGYNYLEFQNEGDLSGVSVLQRDKALNPFHDVNMVFVPYCTGDVHAGDHVQTYGWAGREMAVYHVGYRNLTAYLRRLASTFPNARHVWLVGSSAGGFGAALNMEHVQRAFWWARVDVIDDSGPLIQPNGDRWEQWRQSWNLQIPPACTGCTERADALARYYAETYPENRFALLSNLDDSVIAAYSGWSYPAFEDNLHSLADVLDQAVNHRYYYIRGAGHVLLGNPKVQQGGVVLQDWLQQLRDESRDWKSVQP